MRWLLNLFRRRKPERPARILVDREGVAYLPVTEIRICSKP